MASIIEWEGKRYEIVRYGGAEAWRELPMVEAQDWWNDAVEAVTARIQVEHGLDPAANFNRQITPAYPDRVETGVYRMMLWENTRTFYQAWYYVQGGILWWINPTEEA